MRTITAILVFAWAGIAIAGGANRRTEQEIQQAVLRNFDACNREDIDDVMDSCADAMPGRGKFRKETLETFKDKDLHYSLVECELLEVKPPWAKARIVQTTHALDRGSKSPEEAGFRNNSALLPKAECVEYINTFKKENGRWKLYLIISEMREVLPKSKAGVESER